MMWDIVYTNAARKDLQKIDGSMRGQVVRAIEKVAQNPVAKNEGGYGEPLGNKGSLDLRGYLKIKLRASGIRVVYRVEEEDGIMRVIIIGVRSDEEVYRLAAKRIREL